MFLNIFYITIQSIGTKFVTSKENKTFRPFLLKTFIKMCNKHLPKSILLKETITSCNQKIGQLLYSKHPSSIKEHSHLRVIDLHNRKLFVDLSRKEDRSTYLDSQQLCCKQKLPYIFIRLQQRVHRVELSAPQGDLILYHFNI